jgi:hypothetical protein
MLKRLRDVENWTMEGVDGNDLGNVINFYFDDRHWTVRYLVVNTGTWLTSRSVLISPMALKTVDWGRGRFSTTLTRDDVKQAPAADIAMPITRRYESAYGAYYGYPPYWIGTGLWGTAPIPAGIRPVGRASEPAPIGVGPDVDESHLRSVNEVSGYHIEALDGEIGHIEDFLADDASWAIRYLVIDTSNWIGGRTVLITPGWARRVDWADRKIHVDLSREGVKNSPQYDPTVDLSRDYEDQLHRYYGRSAYWNP